MNEKRQIVNIITFIRELEPRFEFDLFEPIAEQIKLLDKCGLKATFLIQYDAMLDPAYTELLLSADKERYELGVWYEVVQPLTEKCGIPWTGRWPWDFHTDCGFPVGYTKEQRHALIDEVFRKFKEIFGYFPRVMGSWLTDSETVRYVDEKYGLDAMCNCKEQYGTDGYTLWGGYYGQGYYPSKSNMFHPAKSREKSIHFPMFRMLGPDPVYQYDLGLSLCDGAEQIQKVVSLEPVYSGSTGGGGDPAWTDWFMRNNFSGECLCFGYAQAGQENGFSWQMMKDGLSYQYPLYERLQKEGKITVEQLGETGRRYKRDYSLTPAATIVAHDAFNDNEKSSVWYDSRFYRVNLYRDGSEKFRIRIRDLHIFSENAPDPYDKEVCKTSGAVYETLPVIDGNRNTGGGVLSGLYAEDKNGNVLGTGELSYREISDDTAVCDYGDISFTLSQNGITAESKEPFILIHKLGKKDGAPKLVSVCERKITLEKDGVLFGIILKSGKFDGIYRVESENGKICAEFFSE